MLLILYLFAFTYAYLRMDLSKVPDSHVSKRYGVRGAISTRNSLYTAQFKVGSRKDEVRVSLLSQLNELWFPHPRCKSITFIEDHIERREWVECFEYGTFDPKNLSTFRLSNTSFESWWNDDLAEGYIGTDVVQFGDKSLNITFGVGYRTDTVGQLGLGFQHDSSAHSNFTSFGEMLVKNGYILRNAYSLQLGANNASEGVLMYGAVDHSKYDGTLQKIKMVNASTDGNFDAILINFDGILYSDGWNFSNCAVILEITRPGLVLPFLVVKKIAELLHGYEWLDLGYRVPCFNLELTDVIRFYFSGVELQVPVRDLITQHMFNCWLSIEYISSGPYLLGQDILKSAYLVVDLEGREVALGQVNSTSNDENIEEIGSTVPLALEAPLYSYTEAQDKYYRYSTLTFQDSKKTQSGPTYSMNTSPLTQDAGGTKYVQTAIEKNWETEKTELTTSTWTITKYFSSMLKATRTNTHTTTDDLGSEVVSTSTYEYSSLTYTKTEWKTYTGTETYLTTAVIWGAPRREDFSSKSSNPGMVVKYLPSFMFLFLLALL